MMLVQRKKIHKLLSAVISMAMIALTIGITVIGAGATGASDRVKENKNGVIRLECIYGESNIPVASYTGFIVNNNLIASSDKAIKLNAERILSETQGENFHYDSSLLKYQVMIEGSNVPATLAQDMTNNSFSLFRLSKAISFDNTNYKALSLGNSSKVADTDTVYAIGYSTTTDNELQINEGKVSKPTSEIIEYTMSNPTEGFIGAPVINESGAVIGITNSLTDDGYKAVAIDCVTTFFNTFSYDYTKAASEGVVVESVDEYSSLTSDESVVSDVSSESGAETVSDSSNESVLEESEAAEGTSDNMVMIIIIIGIGVVVVALVVVMIILATRKKPTVAPKGPYPAASRPYQPQTPSASAPAPSVSQMPGYQQPSGSSETTLLGAGSSETTFLGIDPLAANPAGVLINLKTGDRIIINKQEFAIGKERSRVDYCISDDSSVSRLHLKVRVRDGRCYIVDMGSKNGTFINGNRLTPNQEFPIRNGDRLDISLKKYEFRG